jgi:hypothetical protein
MTGRTRAAALAAGVCSFVLASPLAAQRAAVHDGFWISVGLGGGLAFGDEEYESDSKSGYAFQLRLGGTPSQQLLLGGELIGWGAEEASTTVWRGAAMFTALYYPSRRGGLYLKGSAGFAGRSVDREIPIGDDSATLTQETGGIGLGAGIGYDIQLGRNFFLTPAVDFVYSGTEGDGATLLLFTVGATWH